MPQRITGENYRSVRAAMERVINALPMHPPDACDKILSAPNDSNLWQVINRANITRALYNQGCFDNHIATAAKKAVREIRGKYP